MREDCAIGDAHAAGERCCEDRVWEGGGVIVILIGAGVGIVEVVVVDGIRGERGEQLRP